MSNHRETPIRPDLGAVAPSRTLIEAFHALSHPTTYADYWVGNQETQRKGWLYDGVIQNLPARFFKDPNETNKNKSQKFLWYFTPITKYLFPNDVGRKIADNGATEADYERTVEYLDSMITKWNLSSTLVDEFGGRMSARAILPIANIVRSMIEVCTYNVAHRRRRQCIELESFIGDVFQIDPEFPRLSLPYPDAIETTWRVGRSLEQGTAPQRQSLQ